MPDAQADAVVTENQDVVENPQADDLAALRAENEALKAEAAKNRALKNKAAKDLEELKSKSKQDTADDYKSLYQQQVEHNEKLNQAMKRSAVESALRSQLSKLGVTPDALDIAMKLVDQNLVEWDVDTGVDSFSVETAAKKVKQEARLLFETKVSATSVKAPAEGATRSDKKTISRADFNALPPAQQAAIARTHAITA